MLIQSQKPALRPLTTAHLAQTMTLLELNGEELQQKIEAALSSNPALELLEGSHCPSCHKPLRNGRQCPVCSSPNTPSPGEPIVFVSPRKDFPLPSNRVSNEDYPLEEWAAEKEDLPTFVFRQIAPDLPVDDRLIAAHILNSLEINGLLAVSLDEIARYHHVPISRVAGVQRMIQRSEPLGVGSTCAQEALMIQLEVLAETRDVPALAGRVIQEGMDLLSRRAYNELGRLLGVTTQEAIQIAQFISQNLNPYPAQEHWGDNRIDADTPPVYKDADIIISRLYDTPETPLVVEIVSPYAGSLRVNPLFSQAISQAPREKAEQWQSAKEEAILLVKCLQQRDHTIVRLMKHLVIRQRKFILKGDAFLKPLTRAKLAEELGVHESTISRAVARKAVQLPNKKIIPLSKWFDRSLHIRTALVKIISEEDQPLSDNQIAEMLDEQGFSVARRTVAKYRNMEGILPARLRNSKTVSNTYE